MNMSPLAEETEERRTISFLVVFCMGLRCIGRAGFLFLISTTGTSPQSAIRSFLRRPRLVPSLHPWSQSSINLTRDSFDMELPGSSFEYLRKFSVKFFPIFLLYKRTFPESASMHQQISCHSASSSRSQRSLQEMIGSPPSSPTILPSGTHGAVDPPFETSCVQSAYEIFIAFAAWGSGTTHRQQVVDVEVSKPARVHTPARNFCLFCFFCSQQLRILALNKLESLPLC